MLLRERDDFAEILAWIVENCPDVTASTCVGPSCDPCVGSGCDPCKGPNCEPPCVIDCEPPVEGGNPGNKKPVGKATENPTGVPNDIHHGVSGGTEEGSTGASSTSNERGPAQDRLANPKTFRSKGKP